MEKQGRPLDGRQIAIDCGRWDPDLQIDNIANVPGGVVETVPVNISASGLIAVPKAYLRHIADG